MATILENSIESLKKCYVGVGEDGKHTLDKSKINDLQFLFAITQVSNAIKKGQLTDAEFINQVSAGFKKPITPMDNYMIELNKKKRTKRSWFGRRK